jgi:hypothetical protein
MAQLSMTSAAVVAPGETARLILHLTPTIGTDVMVLKTYGPTNTEFDLSQQVRAVEAGGAATLAFYVADVIPGVVGDWYFRMTDTNSGDWGECMISVRSWAGNMDKPVSDVLKQRVDIGRLRTNIRNQGGR